MIYVFSVVFSMVISDSQKQDTGKFRKNAKDQFYTSQAVAKACIDNIIVTIPDACKYVWVEPSAGSGSFLHSVPDTFEKIGLDLDPKAEGIQVQDYLTWTPPIGKEIIVFGNPPFGRQSSLAKSFISKSCEFASIIAFILPKSFTKPSMFNAFSLKFHLIKTVDLEKDSFMLNDCKYDVPCVFQIWRKQDVDRPVTQKIEPTGFRYVKSSDPYHIALRRVGGLAGKCYRNTGSNFSIQSHYFILFEESAFRGIDSITKKINEHVFPSNTLGPRSLSKCEVNTVINSIIRSSS